ncbi:MAG: hypothetical protein ACYC6W_08855 [Nitrosotalea sp.]
MLKQNKWGGLSEKDTQITTTLQKNFHVDCKGISNDLLDKLIHEGYSKERGFPMMAKSCNDVMPMIKEINRNAVPNEYGYAYTQKQRDDIGELMFESQLCYGIEYLQANNSNP